MSTNTNQGAELPKVFIYGSCVSRDTYEFLRDSAKLERYVARQSVISAFAPVTGIKEKLTEIASPFQERMVLGDLSGSLPNELRTNAADVDLLVMDLVDERGGVLSFDDGVATRLAEFWSSGGREASSGVPHVAFGSDEHFDEWCTAISKLRELLVELDLLDRTLVLRSKWASNDNNGDPINIPGWMMKPARANELYARYFAKLEELEFAVVALPDELAYSPLDHKWGTSPFHYSDEAYQYFATHIRERLGAKAQVVPKLQRRDLAPWGQFQEVHSVDEFRQLDTITGYTTVWHNGWPIDLLIEDNQAATTLVSFHAALGSKATIKPPVFTGRSITEKLPVNRVFISDPTLLTSETLSLGWYLGTSTLPLTELLRDIIATTQSRLGAQHLAFYGMSGGGFASLNLSHEFPGSLAIPVNPQTRILDYAKAHWQAMAEAAFGVEGPGAARAALELHPRADQRLLYSRGYSNSVLYLQNRKDGHISNQLIPFMETVDWPDDMGILFGDWGEGHVPPKAPVLAGLLSAIPKADGDWIKLADTWGARLAPTRDWARNETGR